MLSPDGVERMRNPGFTLLLSVLANLYYAGRGLVRLWARNRRMRFFAWLLIVAAYISVLLWFTSHDFNRNPLSLWLAVLVGLITAIPGFLIGFFIFDDSRTDIEREAARKGHPID